MRSEREPGAGTRVWELPLRLWHWAFAAAVAFSLYSGLAGDIALMEWHLRCGFVVIALIAFRLAWGVWGGRHARFGSYVTTPRRVFAWLAEALRQRRPPPIAGRPESPHTAPGIALVALMFFAVAAQAVTGLFASDDIFTEGPLHRRVDDDMAVAMNWMHHRLFWAVLALIGTHLAAHLAYAAFKDPTPLAMITGRKSVETTPAGQHLLRGAATLALAAGLVYGAFRFL